MLIPDVNILLHAHRPDIPNSGGAREWLEAAAESGEGLGLSEPVWSGFLRIATNPRVFEDPSTMEQAAAFIEDLFAIPHCVPVMPGPRHRAIFMDLCHQAGVRGDRVPDAYLAALAIETGAVFITRDRGFGRYPGLRWRDPLSPPPSPT